jgi:hypothetical protein
VLTFIGSLGEAFAPSTPDVPRAVLVTSGVVGGILSVALSCYLALRSYATECGEAAALARALAQVTVRNFGSNSVILSQTRFLVQSLQGLCHPATQTIRLRRCGRAIGVYRSGWYMRGCDQNYHCRDKSVDMDTPP